MAHPLFKLAFEQPAQLAALCCEHLPAELAQAIAWDTAKPSPTSFIDPKLADFHADLLVHVELAEHPAYLYLLVEHQSTSDSLMPLRVLHYMVRVWMRHASEHGLPLPPLIAILVSHAPGGWQAAQSVHELVVPSPDQIPGLARFVPNATFILDDLQAQDDEALRGRALAAFPKLALWLLKSGRNGPALLEALDAWQQVLAELLRAPSGTAALAHLLRYIALVSSDLNYGDFHGKLLDVLPQTEETLMTIAEQLRSEGLTLGRQEGREQGRQEGREQGRQEALRNTATKLLALKFGDAATAHAPMIAAATPEQLESLIERILTAKSLDELFPSS